MKFIGRLLKPYKDLSLSVCIVCFSTMVNCLGSFVGVVLTLLLTEKLGYSSSFAGVLVATNAALGFLGAMIGGKMIDSIGRKKVVVPTRLAAAAGYIFCAFISQGEIITILLMISSFFGGMAQPAFSTIIADLTQGEERKVAFSLNYMAINVGMSVGALTAGFLFRNYLKLLFLGDALTTIISVILLIIFVPESKPEIDTEKKSKEGEAKQEGLLSAIKRNPNLIKFSGIITVLFIVFFQMNFGMPLQTESIFGEKGVQIYGVLYTINTIVCVSATIFINDLFKGLKPAMNIMFGGLFYTVGFGMIFFVNSFWGFALSTVIWTVGEILIGINTEIYIADHTPVAYRGRFNSIFPLIRKAGKMIAPLIGGVCAEVMGIRFLWVLMGSMAFISSLLMFKLHRNDLKDSFEDDLAV